MDSFKYVHTEFIFMYYNIDNEGREVLIMERLLQVKFDTESFGMSGVELNTWDEEFQEWELITKFPCGNQNSIPWVVLEKIQELVKLGYRF